MNAGILLFNLDNIRNSELNFLKIYSYICKNANNFKYYDQDFINIIFNQNINYLDYSYNVSEDDIILLKRLKGNFQHKIIYYYGEKMYGICPKPHNFRWWFYASRSINFNFLIIHLQFIYFKLLE
ncbi:glycosyltransferase [Campylobacter jejuni]|uniref:glycosyltransferase n=1 Tax=Campylobacter jejuni TaxID=197 RepID=UPI003364CAF4